MFIFEQIDIDGQIFMSKNSERSVVIMARRASEETARITFDDGVTMIAPKYLCLQVVARAQLPER